MSMDSSQDGRSLLFGSLGPEATPCEAKPSDAARNAHSPFSALEHDMSLTQSIERDSIPLSISMSPSAHSGIVLGNRNPNLQRLETTKPSVGVPTAATSDRPTFTREEASGAQSRRVQASGNQGQVRERGRKAECSQEQVTERRKEARCSEEQGRFAQPPH